MSDSDNKEPVYCIRCKYHQPNSSSGIMGEYDRCAAVIKNPTKVSPVTGQIIPCEFGYCIHLNKDADCDKYEPAITEDSGNR